MALPQSFEPISNAVHLSVDMQNLFAPGGIWGTPWMEKVLPAIVTIAELNPPRTVFTRFVTPLQPGERPGRWQRYFTKWECATRSRLSPSQLEIVPPLSRLVPPATSSTSPPIPRSRNLVLHLFSTIRTSTLSLSPVPKPMFACWLPCSTPWILVSASSWSRMRCAVLSMRDTMRS